MIGNDECECLKIVKIGQSAAKLPIYWVKVQRLSCKGVGYKRLVAEVVFILYYKHNFGCDII